MTDSWFPHVTVAAIGVRDGQYLLVQETINGKLVLNQPAGHVDQNETLHQAVIRETLEETGWHFEPKCLTGIYQYIAPNGETYFRFTFFGELIGHDDTIELDTPIDQVVWMDKPTIERQSNLRSQSVLKCIEDYEAGRQWPLELLTALVE